jgi:methyl-accepting chemotaxis protein
MRLNVRSKILGGSLILLVLIGLVGVLGVTNLISVRDKAQAAYSDGLTPVENLAALDTALTDKARAVTYGVVMAGQADAQATIDSQIAADDAKIAASLTEFTALPLGADQTATLADLRTQMADYQKLVDPIRTLSKEGNAAQAASQIAAATTVRGKVMADVTTLMGTVQAGAHALNDQIGSTFQFGLVATILLVLLAIVVGLVASLLISGGISRGTREDRQFSSRAITSPIELTHEGLSPTNRGSPPVGTPRTHMRSTRPGGVRRLRTQ